MRSGYSGEAMLQHELNKRQPFDSLGREAYLSLIRTAAMLEGEAHSLLKQHKLTSSSYNVLRILRGRFQRPGNGESGSVSCHDITKDMVVRVPDVTRLVDRLKARGLVSRERSNDDRRVVLISISPAGLKVLEQLDAPLAGLHVDQFDALSPAEAQQLIEMLSRVRQRFRQRELQR